MECQFIVSFAVALQWWVVPRPVWSSPHHCMADLQRNGTVRLKLHSHQILSHDDLSFEFLSTFFYNVKLVADRVEVGEQ